MKRDGMIFPVSFTGENDDDLAEALESFGVDVGPENNEVAVGGPNYSNSEQGGLSAEWDVGLENFDFTSITAWRYWELATQQDIDGLPYEEPINKEFFFFSKNGTGEKGQQTDQFTQEFRLTSTAWDTLNLTTGLFYFKQDLDRFFERQIEVCPPANWDPELPYGAPCPAGESSRYGSADLLVDTESIAAFGQADWRFADTLSLSVGLRYTYDESSFFVDRETPQPGPALPASFSGGNSDDGSGVTGRLALQWDVSNEAMASASYTRGYKAQTYDVIFGTTSADIEPAPEETADAYELGLKGEYFENRLRLGATLFHTRFNDFQGQSLDPETLAFSLTSAGNAVTQGLELAFMARPTPNLLVSGGVALIDAYYDEFTGAACWDGQTEAQGCVDGVQDLTDAQLENSPELKYTLQTRYDIPLDASFDMYVSANYRWQDEMYSQQDHQPEMIIPSYSVLDTTIGINSDDGQWDLALFVKNALDDFYEIRRSQMVFDNNSSISHGLARDYTRYAGIKFTYKWGSFYGLVLWPTPGLIAWRRTSLILDPRCLACSILNYVIHYIARLLPVIHRKRTLSCL
jgi:iron complex outermembrane receptor protein